MHAAKSFKSLVHEALGGAAERVYEAMSPFENPSQRIAPRGISHDGSGDQPGQQMVTDMSCYCYVRPFDF